MEISKQGQQVRALLESERNGLLCTLSKKLEGWPFGSVTPYTLLESGAPAVLISDIAEHTRNIRGDARVSLLVQDSRALEDPQAGARATVIGYAIPVPPPLLDDGQRRYADAFPNSSSYFEAHDFSLFQVEVAQVRFIGGFGEIYWIDGREIRSIETQAGGDPLAPHVEMICEHMNEDHADALRLYAAAFADLSADSARMVHVDSDGFDMIVRQGPAHRHARISFPEPVTTTESVRAVMVDMVRRARQITASSPQPEG